MHVSAKTHRPGWTLFQVVVAIVVMGVLFVAAMPTYRIDSKRVDSAARRLQSDMRYAQQLAMSTRRHTWVTLDVNNETYRLYIEDPAQLGKANRIAVTDPVDRSDFVVVLDTGEYSGVGIVSADFDSNSEVEFDSVGMPMDGDGTALSGVGTVTLTGGRQVLVEPNSGAVRVQ